MRGREFTMKDAYSFDRDAEGAAVSYDKMYQAYQRIFTRLGLMFRAVRADTGAIGGSRSHEFQVIANAGEDVIAYCPDSDYAANIELAEARSLIDVRAAAAEEMVKRPTPGKEKCHDVAEFLGIPFEKSVKSVVLAADRTDEKRAIRFPPRSSSSCSVPTTTSTKSRPVICLSSRTASASRPTPRSSRTSVPSPAISALSASRKTLPSMQT